MSASLQDTSFVNTAELCFSDAKTLQKSVLSTTYIASQHIYVYE